MVIVLAEGSERKAKTMCLCTVPNEMDEEVLVG